MVVESAVTRQRKAWKSYWERQEESSALKERSFQWANQRICKEKNVLPWMTVISWYFRLPWSNGALGSNLGWAHLRPANLLGSHCTFNCFSCPRKQALENVAQPDPKWFSLFLSLTPPSPSSYKKKCNLTDAIAALMTLRLYRLMVIFLNANLSFGTKGHWGRQ